MRADDADYFTAAEALNMRPRESLIEAAQRFMRNKKLGVQWRVAHAILHADNDNTAGSWAGIRKAAKAARAIKRAGLC